MLIITPLDGFNFNILTIVSINTKKQQKLSIPNDPNIQYEYTC